MRILIADDHAVVRRGLEEIVEDAMGPIEFGEAGNAAEATQLFREHPWDMAIVDITMPGQNGLDVLKTFQNLRPKVPVLILSMHPESQYALRALKAGAAGYLTKESAPTKLVEAVKTVLAGKPYVSAALAERLALLLRTGGDVSPHEQLSDREFHVMQMIASGRTVSEIAGELSLSVKTVSTYRSRVLAKTGMRTNAELTRYVLETGLLE